MPDEIATKLVFTGDSAGAVKASAEAAAGVRQLTQQAVQSEQAVKAAAGAVTTSNAGGQLLGQLGSELGGLAARVPGVNALGGAFTALASGPVAAATAAIGGISAAVGIAEKSVEAFANKQDRVARLDAALAQEGELTDAVRVKYQALAGEYGKLTGQGGRWLDVITTLKERGKDVNADNIGEYLEAVKNLSGEMGGNTERAAQLFARALDGNFTALRRFGVEVDTSKSKHEQLEQAMQQLAARGGGQLESQTQTLHGQFGKLSGAVGGLFSGFGNLISRTGILQVTLTTLTKVVQAVGDLFPKTVAKIEDSVNKLPTMGDKFRDLGGDATAAGGDMAELGTSAVGAVDGVEKLSAEAEKAKKSFQGAANAAKELRERQDLLADAATAEKLAGVKLREAKQEITPQEAEKERAAIRAGAERAKYERQIAEQTALVDAAEKRIGTVHEDASASEAEAVQAKEDFERQKAAIIQKHGGLPGVENVNADTIKPGINPYSALAQGQREKAEQAQSAATAYKTEQRAEYADPKEAARLQAEAKAAAELADNYDKLAGALTKSVKTRLDATAARKEEEAVTKEAGKERDKAADARTAARTQQHAAGLTATAEEIMRQREAEKKDLETAQKVLEKAIRKTEDPQRAKQLQGLFDENAHKLNQLTNGGDPLALSRGEYLKPEAPAAEQRKKLNDERIKTIDLALKKDAELRKELEAATQQPDSKEAGAVRALTGEQLQARGLLSPEARAAAERRRQRMEEENAADAERGDGPQTRQQEDFNRHAGQGERFGQTVGASASGAQVVELGEEARGLVSSAGPSTPGSATANAVAAIQQLVAKVERQGGADAGTDAALARALTSFADTMGGKLLETASKAELASAVRKIENLENQIKQGR